MTVTLGRYPYILTIGLDLTEAHLVPLAEDVIAARPSITAAQVVDRATLKQFVDEAVIFSGNLFRTGGISAISRLRVSFRDPNGPWRSGPTYLFSMDETGYTHFHGAFPDRFENLSPRNTLREVLPSGEPGDLILPKIIEAAQSNPDGAFVEYYFDNPDDPNDDFNTLKVSYVRLETVQIPGVGETRFIIGAGIYGDSSTVAEDVCPRPAGLAANPLETPVVTAARAAGSAANLKAFALAGRDYANVTVHPGRDGSALKN